VMSYISQPYGLDRQTGSFQVFSGEERKFLGSHGILLGSSWDPKSFCGFFGFL